MKISKKARFVLLPPVLVLLYLAGVIARQYFGVRVEVHNNAEESLRQVSVKLERNREYSLGEMAAGGRKTVYVEPSGGDSICLEVIDSSNVQHTSLIAGYVENGYCGEVSTQIAPDGQFLSVDHSFAPFNWKSWWAFTG